LTRFFGREAEAAELVEVLGKARLVTLVGAPGCGKTRFAIEVAEGRGHPSGSGSSTSQRSPIPGRWRMPSRWREVSRSGRGKPATR
jgi:hypothetical protein